MPFAKEVAYFVKGQHARVESGNKQECSIQLGIGDMQPPLDSTNFRFSSPPRAKWSIFIMSRSKANSVYKRLLHRSLHKSTKAHLMKVYDPSHRDLHASYDSGGGSESMPPLSTFIWFELAHRAVYPSLHIPSMSFSYYRHETHHKNIAIGFTSTGWIRIFY